MMATHITKKLSKIADDFMKSAGVPFGKTPLGQDLCNALTDDENIMVSGIVFGGVGDALAADVAEIDKKTIKLAETFVNAAKRVSKETEAINCIPVSKTDKDTADQLEQSGAPVFAELVRKARVAKP